MSPLKNVTAWQAALANDGHETRNALRYHNPGQLQQIENAGTLLALTASKLRHGEQPEQPAAPSAQWSCPRCGSPRWVAASLTGPVQYGGSAIKQCVPCGHYSNSAAEGRSVEPPARAYDSMPLVEVPRELAVPAAQALRNWHARNAAVCEHTQFVSYGEAADQMLAAVLPHVRAWIADEIEANVERDAPIGDWDPFGEAVQGCLRIVRGESESSPS